MSSGVERRSDAAPTRFVVLAVPRTGSNLLCTLLNSHPEILCHHELFNPRGVFTAWSLRDHDFGLGSIEDRDRKPLEFLENVWSTGTGYRFVGFKWTRRQNETVLDALASDRRVKKIVLRRRNRIKTFVSDKIAQATDQWEVYSASELQQPRPRIAVDLQELAGHIEENAGFYRRLERKLQGQPWCTTHYEQLFDLEEQRRLLRFLEVDTVELPLQAASVKQNPSDLRELISNYDDCLDRLRGTPLEEELTDDGL